MTKHNNYKKDINLNEIARECYCYEPSIHIHIC